MGRPKTGETAISTRVTTETAQLLNALATAKGVPVDAYINDIVIYEHLEAQKSNPVLANWYKANYPILHTQGEAEAAPKPQKGKGK